jgi:hypothetical protein
VTTTPDLVEQFADPELSARKRWEERQATRAERLERITARAERARPGRTLLLLITSVLFGIAWCIGKVFLVLFRSGVFIGAALQEGWDEASGRGPSKSELMDQNAFMRDSIQRMGGDLPPPLRKRATKGVR